MGDFHQYGQVTTLHQLNQRPLEELEAELMEFRKSRPMALILPSLFSELENPAQEGWGTGRECDDDVVILQLTDKGQPVVHGVCFEPGHPLEVEFHRALIEG